MQNWIICLGKITYWLAFSRWKFDLVYTFFLPAAFGKLRCWKGFDDVSLSISLASWQCSFFLLHLLGRERHCCWKSRSSPDLGQKKVSGTDGQVSWSAVIRLFFFLPPNRQTNFWPSLPIFLPGQFFLWDFYELGRHLCLSASLSLSLFLSPSFFVLLLAWHDNLVMGRSGKSKEDGFFISD